MGGWVGSSPYSGTRPPGTRNYQQLAALLQTERRHRHVNGILKSMPARAPGNARLPGKAAQVWAPDATDREAR